jgi:hypothetical protein
VSGADELRGISAGLPHCRTAAGECQLSRLNINSPTRNNAASHNRVIEIYASCSHKNQVVTLMASATLCW